MIKLLKYCFPLCLIACVETQQPQMISSKPAGKIVWSCNPSVPTVDEQEITCKFINESYTIRQLCLDVSFVSRTHYATFVAVEDVCSGMLAYGQTSSSVAHIRGFDRTRLKNLCEQDLKNCFIMSVPVKEDGIF